MTECQPRVHCRSHGPALHLLEDLMPRLMRRGMAEAAELLDDPRPSWIHQLANMLAFLASSWQACALASVKAAATSPSLAVINVATLVCKLLNAAFAEFKYMVRF